MTTILLCIGLVIWWVVGMWKYARDFEPIETIGDCLAMFFMGGIVGAAIFVCDAVISPALNIKIRRRK